MMTNTIDFLYQENILFLKSILAACQFSECQLSAIPSFLFLSFTFVFFQNVIHRRTNRFSSYKAILYREMGFQWTFFYLARMWILCVKGTRWLVEWLDNYLKMQHSQNEFIWITSLRVRASLFSVLTCISLIPLGLVVATCMYQQTIPNFLMWVGEDPWIRSEMGISGHYLQRPLNFIPEKRKEYAYRSRRSMSVEHRFLRTVAPPLRNCKSLEAL